jgi:type IV secretory pathway VirB2 component (pilin)
LGRAIAVLSVIVVGIGATLGKVSWGLALTVGTGIATVFGAVPLVMYLIGTNQICYDVGGIA